MKAGEVKPDLSQSKYFRESQMEDFSIHSHIYLVLSLHIF